MMSVSAAFATPDLELIMEVSSFALQTRGLRCRDE